MKDEQTYKSVGLFRRTVRLLDARITEIELSDDPWQELSRIVAPNPIESESSE